MANTTRAKARHDDSKTDLQWIIDGITSGDHDGGIAKIADAVAARVKTGQVTIHWRIDLGDVHVGEEDLTLDEAYKIEAESGTNWQAINPTRSARDCRALLKVLLQTRGGLEAHAADDRLAHLTVTEVLDAISLHDEVDAPLDRPEDSTGTS